LLVLVEPANHIQRDPGHPELRGSLVHQRQVYLVQRDELDLVRLFCLPPKTNRIREVRFLFCWTS
jgi:hypothetical protein